MFRVRSILTAAAFGVLSSPVFAGEIVIPVIGVGATDLQVEGGGTQQVHQLDNGNFLGLWGFDNRAETRPTLLKEEALLDNFSNSSSIQQLLYGSVDDKQEFDPVEFFVEPVIEDGQLISPPEPGFQVGAGERLFDSLWIEWTGGNLVYNFEGKTRTMSDTVTLDGDPIAVPAPGTLALLGVGILGLAALRWRRRPS